MKKFVPYEQRYKRYPDFIVEYKLIREQNDFHAGLKQGMRSDFCYEEDYDKGPIHMIWPEFLDEDGEIICDTDAAIADHGYARMWIMMDEKRPVHKKRLKEGAKGYLVTGSHKIAEVRVVQII